MKDFKLKCSECEAVYSEEEVELVCPKCSLKQRPGGIVRGVLLVQCQSFPRRLLGNLSHNDPQRLVDFLPIKSISSIPDIQVGGTPLLSVPRLRKNFILNNLWLKDDTRNPSGSTKDRASLLVVIKAIEYGYKVIVSASTGNAATALAAMAGAAGLQSVVIVPKSAPPAKLIQMLSYGAKVIPVNGSYDQAFELSLEISKSLGFYNRNTAYNPFTIEGKKTLGLEIAWDLLSQKKCPDVVLVPVGDGVIISGVAKGFKDLVEHGLLPRMPRLIAVQPEKSCAIVNSLVRDLCSEPDIAVKDASSVADSLNVNVPRNALLCLKDIKNSQGSGVKVSDQEILESIGFLAKHTGVFAEPAGASVIAGLRKALEKKLVEKDENIVLVVTGTGLKDIAAAAKGQIMPPTVEPVLEELKKLLAVPSEI